MPEQNNRASSRVSGSRPAQKRRRRLNPFAAVGKAVAIVFMICVITGCIVASVMTVYVLNTLDQGDSVVLEDVELNYSTIIYAYDQETGEEIELQRLQDQTGSRIWVDYGEIPQCVKDAAVAVEDKRFWTHSGVDFRRTIHAAVNMFNPFADEIFGGSTITQQVVKNATKDDEFRVDRKLREIFRAINLEKYYSKEQILEAYLNIVSFSSNQNGVQAAANLYFGKDISDVTPAEAAAIIATTQNPYKWDPFRFPENNRERQLMVLRMMHEQERPDGTPMLTDEEYEAAVNQEMVFQKEQYIQRSETVQNWFVDTVYEEVLNDLVEQAGYTRAGASEAMLSGGFRIYTTVDVEMQDYLEKKYSIDSETGADTFPTVRNEEYPESAFVILDPYSGEIKAVAGSNRQKTGARLFNRATSAIRHPGSTIKPLASYAPAVEGDYIHFSSVWEDSPILLDEEDPTSTYPVNFYGNYMGNITITTAIQRSTNTIPVKLVRMLSPRTCFNFLRDQLNFKNLVESETINGQVFSDIDLAPMALGAMTGGVTPLEMAGGYQIFANGGLYYEPHSYTKVLDAEGNVILENKVIPKRVISQETSTIMNRLLQRVVNASPGTGTTARFGGSDMPIAGKTGTSDKDYNQWFIGLTPYYVGACWLGYDEGSVTVNYSGYSYPPPIIWKNVMAPIHANLPIKGFQTYGNVAERQYCLESGCLAGPLCSQIGIGWYKLSNEPPVCTLHVETEEGENEGEGNESFEGSDDYWSWLYNYDSQQDYYDDYYD